jgi:hypothetical protein
MAGAMNVTSVRPAVASVAKAAVVLQTFTPLTSTLSVRQLADEAHDLCVAQFGMASEQPENRVGAVVTARKRRVFRRALGLYGRHGDLGLGQLQPVLGILLRTPDLVARQLARRNRVHTLDTRRDVSIGNAFDLKYMETAKFGDLVERQRCILDKPDGSGFRHQWPLCHKSLPSLARP